ncbi:hypothetical protein F2P81_015863 [Scophthalmus maximus]|uniref:Uncharacterized protein n=1 Tax=Scophthalmus maximus TaxID=52904 RepID=A0A6A4SGG1_SCOMX|nr:hypothetical protein F2P81_015863 [Scophthalmus maximus]
MFVFTTYDRVRRRQQIQISLVDVIVDVNREEEILLSQLRDVVPPPPPPPPPVQMKMDAAFGGEMKQRVSWDCAAGTDRRNRGGLWVTEDLNVPYFTSTFFKEVVVLELVDHDFDLTWNLLDWTRDVEHDGLHLELTLGRRVKLQRVVGTDEDDCVFSGGLMSRTSENNVVAAAQLSNSCSRHKVIC